MESSADKLERLRIHASAITSTYGRLLKQFDTKQLPETMKRAMSERVTDAIEFVDRSMSAAFKHEIESSPQADVILDYYLAQCKQLEAGTAELERQIDVLL